jgi:monofunctional glycosyltransferase
LSRPKKKRPFIKILTWGLQVSFKTLLILWILTIIEVVSLRFLNPPCTVLMAWSWVESKVGKEPYQGLDYEWKGLKEISPHLIKAVQAGEDQRFLQHHGFDFTEINKVLEDNFLSGRTRGASTISMQAARTVFLWPGRNWLRKTAEAYYTLLIELFWDKRRIIEVYINTVDWGPGVLGAEAASRRYFGKASAHLTPAQAALLAAVLPNPHKWSPVNPSEWVQKRQQRIMREMVRMPSFRIKDGTKS